MKVQWSDGMLRRSGPMRTSNSYSQKQKEKKGGWEKKKRKKFIGNWQKKNKKIEGVLLNMS
eukprot:8393107-Heterocapsa_arctica.AAC.1